MARQALWKLPAVDGSDSDGDLVCRIAGPCDNRWTHGGACTKDECCEASPPTPMDSKFEKPSVAAVAKTVEKLLNDAGLNKSGLLKIRAGYGLDYSYLKRKLEKSMHKF